MDLGWRGGTSINRNSRASALFRTLSVGVPGARMYKSGDVGRWRADGNIEFWAEMTSK